MVSAVGFAWDLHGRQVVAFAAVLVSLGIIWRYIVTPTVRLFQRMDRALNFVERELKPNGGSSLRDAVNRIDERVSAIETRVQAEGRTANMVSEVLPILPKGHK